MPRPTKVKPVRAHARNVRSLARWSLAVLPVFGMSEAVPRLIVDDAVWCGGEGEEEYLMRMAPVAADAAEAAAPLAGGDLPIQNILEHARARQTPTA